MPSTDDVVVLHDVERVFRREPVLPQFDFHFGVDIAEFVGGGLALRPAHVGGSVDDLPLQVRRIDDVEVDEAERADSGGGEVEAPRGEPNPPVPMTSTLAA